MQLTPPLAAYPYVQYNDDDDIAAFFKAYNTLAQEYVDFFANYNFADFNSTLIAGKLLDWCIEGIYGMPRPFLVVGNTTAQLGPYGTLEYGLYPYGHSSTQAPDPASYSYVSDDIYRRVVTWNFYKGDGVYFNAAWLKRRIARFLTGATYPDNTYDVSVSFPGGSGITLGIPASNELSSTLQALIASNIVQLPFQYAFTVNLV